MEPIVASAEISRRPEDVFAYITDPSHLPQWQESVVRVKTTTVLRLAAGREPS